MTKVRTQSYNLDHIVFKRCSHIFLPDAKRILRTRPLNVLRFPHCNSASIIVAFLLLPKQKLSSLPQT